MVVSKKYLKSRFPTGKYTGNGTSQVVECGFRPRRVLITTADGKRSITKHDGSASLGYGQVAGGSTGISMRSFKISEGYGITITDTGFTVDDNPNLNAVGEEYIWEAI